MSEFEGHSSDGYDKEDIVGSISDVEAKLLASNAPLSELEYTIESCSSFSSSYEPHHIMENDPSSQASRWSSGSSARFQHITLRLSRTAIVDSIGFGKFHKVHVCNLKEFEVFGGMELNQMKLLLHAGLRNDTIPEIFELRKSFDDIALPIRYIRIVPLQTWKTHFNFSIWFVRLVGWNSDVKLIEECVNSWNQMRAEQSMRLCLRHVRERGFFDEYSSLLNKTETRVEHPLLSQLFDALVRRGDFDESEKLLSEAHEKHFYAAYAARQPPELDWREIFIDGPSARGGHQMCVDVEKRAIFLFGGWDGQKEMGDLWSFDLDERFWKCVSKDVSKDGGPHPRSCHKSAYDALHRRLYTLGRFVETDNLSASERNSLKNDFHYYDVEADQWHLISEDVESDGGPPLIYDHAMVIDCGKQVIYVFGGRIISNSSSDNLYAGLYRFDIASGHWTLLREDAHVTNALTTTRAYRSENRLLSRIGHSMLLDTSKQCIYVFAGQRDREFLSDFFVYDIANDEIRLLARDNSRCGGPDAGFTQRATIDPARGECYVLLGLTRGKYSATEKVKNSFWVYNLKHASWTKASATNETRPRPRFAHQLVYDSLTGRQYLFGGNPGTHTTPRSRLSDFWSLSLTRTDEEAVHRRSSLVVRELRYLELQRSGKSLEALQYLQREIVPLVDHNDTKEQSRIKSLTSALFLPTEQDEVQSRVRAFNELMQFMPREHAQPTRSLLSLD